MKTGAAEFKILSKILDSLENYAKKLHMNFHQVESDVTENGQYQPDHIPWTSHGPPVDLPWTSQGPPMDI